VFDNVENSRALVGPGPEPQKVADQMSSAWIAFARTGDPNTSLTPHWPRYDATRRATMVFNVASTVVDDPYADVRKALA